MLATAAYARTAFVTPVATVDRLARDVKAAGIRRVTGRVLGDGSRFDRLRAGPLWKPGFAGLECAPLAALGHRPQPRRRQAGRPARSSPPPGRCGPRYPRRREGRRPRRGGQGAGRRRHRRERRLARAAPRALVDGQGLGQLHGRDGAEERGGGEKGVGRTTTRRDPGPPVAGGAPAAAGRRARSSTARGLSPANRLTADLLTSLLAEAASDPALAGPLRASLAVAGVDGTLDDRMRDGPAKRRRPRRRPARCARPPRSPATPAASRSRCSSTRRRSTSTRRACCRTASRRPSPL